MARREAQGLAMLIFGSMLVGVSIGLIFGWLSV